MDDSYINLDANKSKDGLPSLDDFSLDKDFKTKIKQNRGHRSISRAILPYSAIYLDISSFTNGELLEIHRYNATMDILNQFENELLNIWRRVIDTSIDDGDLSYEDWLKAIKLPDLNCIYYGVYMANYPGINSYNVTCDNPNCDNSIRIEKENYEISYISSYSKFDISEDIINKIDRGVNRSLNPIWDVSNAESEVHGLLPDSKFKIFYKMPTLYDTLVFLRFLKKDLNTSDEILKKLLYPISWLGIGKTDRHVKDIIIANKYNLYISKVYAPVEIDGDIQYVNVDQRYIYRLIHNLSVADFSHILNDNGFNNMLVKDGISFRLEDVVCPRCRTLQLPITLDMRDILFYSGSDRDNDYSNGYLTDDMKDGNTDVRYSFTSTMDSVTDLFNGKLTLKEIMDMDMPFMRSLVKSRLENLKRRKMSSGDLDFEKLLNN